MEVHDILENITNHKENSEEREDTVDEVKSKLKKQINQLKSLIMEIEWSLDVVKFGKAKCISDSKVNRDRTTNDVPDIDAYLESQVHKYSGFYCVKFSKNEHVFHFSPSNKHDKKDIFAVQILTEQGKAVLGKWVMPMNIDLNELASEYLLTELKNIPRFLRVCKQFIDCYFIRRERYMKLMGIISHRRSCKLQTNFAYTQIILELMRMYIENSYVNVIIYLLYHVGETVPYKVEVDSLTGNKLGKKAMEDLKACLEDFKNFDLHVAFENMLDRKLFAWMKEDDQDSPVDVNTLSESDGEGFLENILLTKERSSVAKRKRSRAKERLKRKKYEKLGDISNKCKHSGSDSFKSKTARSENDIEPLVSQQNVDAIEPTSKVTKMQPKKLIQTTLKLASNDSLSSDTATLKTKNSNEQLNKPFTSTPLRKNNQVDDIDISDITVSENYIDVVAKGKHKENGLQNTPVKLIQKKMKGKMKSRKSK